MAEILEHHKNKSLAFLRHTLGLVYTLVLLSVGMATSVYFAMTEDTSRSTQFHDAFFFAVYLTGIAATLSLAVYMWLFRESRYISRRLQIHLARLSLGNRLAGLPDACRDDSIGDGNGGLLPFVGHCGEGFNAYLRAGLVVFTLGTVALNLLLMAAPHHLDAGESTGAACAANPFKTALYACQLAFVAACGGLLAVGHRAVFLRHRGLASALLGHQLTACLCIWAHTSVAEISEAVLLARRWGNSSGTAYAAALQAEARCPEQRTALDAVVPYLSPAKVEFSLLAAPMTLQLLAYVGDRRAVEDNLEQVGGARGELGKPPSDHSDWLTRIKSLRATRRDLIGPAFGLVVFISTLGVTVGVMTLVDDRHAALAYLLHTALLQAAAVASAAPALWRLRRMEFVKAEKHAFDDRLLIAAFLGCLFYAMFSLCALLANLPAYPLDLAALEAVVGFLAVVQVVLQTPLLLDGMRRRLAPGRSDHPGRCLIALLLSLNLSLWLLGTFESRRMDGIAEPLLAGRVSVVGYRIVMHVGLPFAVLFRFHSSVCCSLIWAKAFTAEESANESSQL